MSWLFEWTPWLLASAALVAVMVGSERRTR